MHLLILLPDVLLRPIVRHPRFARAVLWAFRQGTRWPR